MHRIAIAALVFLGACHSEAPAEQPRSLPPDLATLRAALDAHRAHRFDAEDGARGCPVGETVGTYVDQLVAYGSGQSPDHAADDVSRLEGGCGEWPANVAPVDPPFDAAYFYCRIDSYTSDAAGESPWHYELRVRVRRSDSALDPTKLGCPGSP